MQNAAGKRFDFSNIKVVSGVSSEEDLFELAHSGAQKLRPPLKKLGLNFHDEAEALTIVNALFAYYVGWYGAAEDARKSKTSDDSAALLF